MIKKRKIQDSSCEPRGFTLIELLLVIAIIAVLSSMAIGVMRKAQDDAKESATLARIKQIEAIIAVEMEDFEVRRLPISNAELARFVQANPNHVDASSNPVKIFAQVRQLRRQILMDIINSELPRPIFDDTTSTFFFNPDVGMFPSTQSGVGTGSLGFTAWLNYSGPDPPNYPNPAATATGTKRLSVRLAELIPARVISYRQNLGQDRDGDGFDDFDLPGEYLYAILERINVDGTPAIESLGDAAVGNTDDDGFKEVVDAWGDPMNLRLWQIAANEVADRDGNSPPGTDVWEDIEANPDFDVRISNIPFGYKVLDPTEPRDLTKIRAEVVSQRILDLNK